MEAALLFRILMAIYTEGKGRLNEHTDYYTRIQLFCEGFVQD